MRRPQKTRKSPRTRKTPKPPKHRRQYPQHQRRAIRSRSATDAPATRATAIAGYDVRSIDVNGNENLLTYEDSNLFFHRVGNLNGNTGDTDTSGLNVVDPTRSTVQSGNSWASVQMPVTLTPTRSGVLQLPTNGASASVADGNGVATATGDDTLVIGGRGVDDRGVSVYGNHNAVTYDDGKPRSAAPAT